MNHLFHPLRTIYHHLPPPQKNILWSTEFFPGSLPPNKIKTATDHQRYRIIASDIITKPMMRNDDFYEQRNIMITLLMVLLSSGWWCDGGGMVSVCMVQWIIFIITTTTTPSSSFSCACKSHNFQLKPYNNQIDSLPAQTKL